MRKTTAMSVNFFLLVIAFSDFTRSVELLAGTAYQLKGRICASRNFAKKKQWHRLQAKEEERWYR